MAFRTIILNLKEALQGMEKCSNPDIKLLGYSNVDIKCIDEDKHIYTLQVPEDKLEADSCLTFSVDCDECDNCPPQLVEKCLCDNIDDCGPCEECKDGFCVGKCSGDQICDEANNICVECKDKDDCPCNQICSAGKCVCPPEAPNELADGCCGSCKDNNDCPACTECVGDKCIPVDCGDGVCDPSQNKCVDCLKSGDCKGENRCCVNKKCVCCEGFTYNPVTDKCEPDAECESDDDCPVCQICTEDGCVPRVCPDGYVCVNDECKKICNCDNPSCPRSEGCVPLNADTCYCTSCEGSCSENGECAKGCYCNPDTGMCEANPCQGSCDDAGDCAGSSQGIACGCHLGQCYPCASLPCDGPNAACESALGCACTDSGNCVGSNCGNSCDNYSDCAPGCACVDGLCISCSQLDCETEECADHPSCRCAGDTCVGGPCLGNLVYCKDAEFGDNGLCRSISVVVDSSGSLDRTDGAYEDDMEESINWFLNKIGNRSSTKGGVITYNGSATTQQPLAGVPSTLNLNLGGLSNYTQGLDKAIGQLDNDTSNCDKWIILLTGGDQTTTNTDPFVNSGVGIGDGSVNGDDLAARDIADAARDKGYNVLVISYGNLNSDCDQLEYLADGDTDGNAENLILAKFPDTGLGTGDDTSSLRNAFKEAWRRITQSLINPASCALAAPGTVDSGGNPVPTYCDVCPTCEEDTADYGYECVDGEGCQYVKGGTLTAKECCKACKYQGAWDCPSTTGDECVPSDSGEYEDELTCNDICLCQSLNINSLSYDLGDQELTYSLSGGSPNYQFKYTGPNGLSGQSGLLVNKTGTVALNGLVAGDYVFTLISSGVPQDCYPTYNLTVSCEAGEGPLITTSESLPSCGNPRDVSFSVTGGETPYTVKVEDEAGNTYAATDTGAGGYKFTTGAIETSQVFTITVTGANGCSSTATTEVERANFISEAVVSKCGEVATLTFRASYSPAFNLPINLEIAATNESLGSISVLSTTLSSYTPSSSVSYELGGTVAVGDLIRVRIGDTSTGCRYTETVTVEDAESCEACAIFVDQYGHCIVEQGEATNSCTYDVSINGAAGELYDLTYIGTDPNVTVTPSTFTLLAGQGDSITIEVDATSLTAGVDFIDLQWEATPQDPTVGSSCESEIVEVPVWDFTAIQPVITNCPSGAAAGTTVTLNFTDAYPGSITQLIDTSDNSVINSTVADSNGEGSISFSFTSEVDVVVRTVRPSGITTGPATSDSTTCNIPSTTGSFCNTQCFSVATENSASPYIEDITFEDGTSAVTDHTFTSLPFDPCNSGQVSAFVAEMESYLDGFLSGASCTPVVTVTPLNCPTSHGVIIRIDCTDGNLDETVPATMEYTDAGSNPATANFSPVACTTC